MHNKQVCKKWILKNKILFFIKGIDKKYNVDCVNIRHSKFGEIMCRDGIASVVLDSRLASPGFISCHMQH